MSGDFLSTTGVDRIVDGDVERSGGIAVCEGAGDGAEASGDAAPASGAEPEESERPDDGPPVADEPATDEPALEVSEASDVPPGSVTVDEPEADAQLDEHDGVVPAEPVAVDAPAGLSGADADALQDPSGPPRGPYLRRGAIALVAAGAVALGVSAFSWIAPSPERADRRFVEDALSLGHSVSPDAQALVISAARKICGRRDSHDTDQERRATALTSDEIAAVGAAFGAETRDFTTLALETYCSR